MPTLSSIQFTPTFKVLKASVSDGVLILEANENFQKSSPRNRFYSQIGDFSLTIPIEGGRGIRGSIKDIKISNETPWRKHHLTTLQMRYSRYPWYEHCREVFESVYARNWIFLWDLNFDLLIETFKCFKINVAVQIFETKEFLNQYEIEMNDYRGLDPAKNKNLVEFESDHISAFDHLVQYGSILGTKQFNRIE